MSTENPSSGLTGPTQPMNICGRCGRVLEPWQARGKRNTDFHEVCDRVWYDGYETARRAADAHCQDHGIPSCWATPQESDLWMGLMVADHLAEEPAEGLQKEVLRSMRGLFLVLFLGITLIGNGVVIAVTISKSFHPAWTALAVITFTSIMLTTEAILKERLRSVET